MDEYIEEYIQIRDRLMQQLQSMMEVYMTGMWDPCMRYIITKEVQELIARELAREYPDFPIEYLPHIKIKVDESIYFIEAGVQAYLNTAKGLNFLGNVDHDGITYDLYCRESWDPNFSHVFYARFGHDAESFEKGSKQPAAEYMMGMMTPLSIAYSFAIDEGYIA